jgi:hypothetical protein
MGTPVAVTYAVIVMCWMERSTGLPSQMLFYTRYIDDVFAICTRRQKEAFIEAFNSIKCDDEGKILFDHDSISPKLGDLDSGSTGIMLDLSVRITANGLLGYSLYQKPLNNHQHIPPLSQHQKHVFPSIVLNELKRARLRSSDPDAYYEQVCRFYKQWTDRAYPFEMLHEALRLVPSRDELLNLAALSRRNREKKKADGWTKRLEKTRPLLASCLPTLMQSDGSRFSLVKIVEKHVKTSELENTREWKQKFASGPLMEVHKNQANIRAILSKR